MPHNMIAGLATVIYRVTDLDRAKAWYSSAFQQTPYSTSRFTSASASAATSSAWIPIRRAARQAPAAASRTGASRP